MEHNRNSIKLKEIIEHFIIQQRLPFTISDIDSTFMPKRVSVIYSGSRCRALVWEEDPPSIYGSSGSIPYVTIYDVDPDKSYTALGDRRCELSVAHPEFFDQLERHLLIDNAAI